MRSESNKLKRVLLACVGILALGVFSLNSIWCGELLGGWFRHAVRVFPMVQVRWDGIIVFVTGFSIATACVHHLAQWWIVERSKLVQSKTDLQNSDDERFTVTWSIRASIAVVLMILSVFAVGISMTGIVHQSGWLITSPTGLTVGKIQAKEDAEMSVYDSQHVPLGASWLTSIRHFLSFMLDENLEGNSKSLQELSFNDPSIALNFQRVLPQAICPSQGNPVFSQDGFGLSHVATNPSALGGKLSDKNSSSIMLGEVNAGFVPWGSPNNIRDPALGLRKEWRGTGKGNVGLGSVHPAGVVVCLMDGSVQTLDEGIDPEVLRQLSNAAIPNSSATLK